MFHSSHTNSRRRSSGFTLVELLVVIGIIAILISVLLPTLASARRSAASVKCLSNLKNLHNAFLMYAGEFKNSMPVGRQDIPDNPPAGPQNQVNLYWQDAIYPYLLKSAIPTNAFTAKELDTYRKSVMWCPVWEADHPEINLSSAYGERFKTGYGYNIWLGFKKDYPNPDAPLPNTAAKPNLAVRWSGAFNSTGKYFKRNEINDQAERMVVSDANLWIIGMKITNPAGDLAGQYVYGQVLMEDSNSPAGATNIDRYRHGKYSSVNGNRHNTKGGLVAFNVLFYDGHAATLNSAADGYRSIRMKYP